MDQCLKKRKKKKSMCQCRRHGFNPWVRKIPSRRKWQPTPVSLLGKSHEQRSLVSYSLSACKRVGHNLVIKQRQQHSFLYTHSTALHMFPLALVSASLISLIIKVAPIILSLKKYQQQH